MTHEEVAALLMMIRAAYYSGPPEAGTELFEVSAHRWLDSLRQWDYEDALDALEHWIETGPGRPPTLNDVIEGVQALRRRLLMESLDPSVDPDTGEITTGDLGVHDQRAQRAIWDGYVGEKIRRGMTRQQAEKSARQSEVLAPWLTPTI